MRAKKGFILAYATVVMAFVMILITGIVTLVDASASIGIRASLELDERMKLDQLGEYFAAGREDLATQQADEWGYVLTIDAATSPEAMTVSSSGEVVLYVERKAADAGGYAVICWIYGSKGE